MSLVETPIETEAPVTVRDSLSAAFDAFEADNPTPAAAPAEPSKTPAAPATDGRERDEHGRFVAKPAEAVQTPSPKLTEPKTPQGAAAPPPQETIRIPPGLSAATKAEFDKLPQHVREDMLKFQQDVETAKTTWDQKAERFNRLDAVLGPRQEFFRLRGLDEVQAISALLAAQDLLERDPYQALLYLGQQRGVDWRQFVARLQGAPAAQQQSQLPPGLQPLAAQVQALTQAFQQQQTAQTTAQAAGYDNQVKAFATDPKNLYFENVRPVIGTLLRSGQAQTLDEAYEKACWSDPQIRPLLLKAQAESQTAAAKQRTAQARHASGSVTGSPAPGGTPQRAGPKPSLRDTLSSKFDEFA